MPERTSPPTRAPRLGDDVVDLRDFESRAGGLHPRFDERVFTVAERRRLETGAAHRLRWVQWALKEATYKAVRRFDPTAIFSPVQIRVVELSDESARISAYDEIFEAKIDGGRDHVHALVGSGVDLAACHGGVRRRQPDEDSSRAVRNFAATRLEERLGLPPGTCRIGREEKLPRLEVGGVHANVPLSLSHHGEFLSFACLLPRNEAGRVAA